MAAEGWGEKEICIEGAVDGQRGEGGDAVHSTSKSSMARPYKMPAQQANRSEAKNTNCPFALEPKFVMKTSICVI